MASGSQAEKEFAAASDTPLVTVAQTARELKQAGGDLWLRTGRGRREAHVKVSHLANLAIAVLAGPPSKAASNVTLFRSLVSSRPLSVVYSLGPARVQETHQDPAGHIFQGADFGEYFENILLWAADPSKRSELEHASVHGFTVEFTLGSRPGVEVLWRNARRDGADALAIFGRQPMTLPLSAGSTAIRTKRIVDLPLIESLASLLRNPSEQPGLSTSPSPSGPASPASDGPGNENAAPARAAPRRPRKRSADSLADLRHLSPAKGERQQRLERGRDPTLGLLPFGGHRDHDTAYSTSADAR